MNSNSTMKTVKNIRPAPLLSAALIALALAANPAGAATFSDDFDTGHDYLVDGVAGTGWDGLLLPTGANATVLDSNSTNAGKLTITEDSSWVATGDFDAPLLYKEMSGDFVATVVIDSMFAGNYHFAGLVALNPGDQDNYVTALARNAGTISIRHFGWSTTNGARAQTSIVTSSTTDAELNYYRLERSGDTFTSRYSDDSGATWTDIRSDSRADLPDTLYVGLTGTTGSSNTGTGPYTAQFESFEVEQVPEPSVALLGAIGVLGLLRRRRIA
jgi:regulation of enolase protein 1 (concanavalin A-like superfamily)